MINCLLVDDEPLARQVLQRFISQTDSLVLAGSCANAMEAFAFLGQHTVDLLFLDIRMPGMSGLDFVRALRQPPAVILTTAYSEYAVTSYELDAIDYLLKPITYERFQKAIARFQKKALPDEPTAAYTYFKVDGRLVRIDHGDLLVAQSIKDYLLLRTTTGNFITHMTMKYLSDLLPSSLFRRVHRSFLVNRSQITSASRRELIVSGISVPVGASYQGGIDTILL